MEELTRMGLRSSGVVGDGEEEVVVTLGMEKDGIGCVEEEEEVFVTGAEVVVSDKAGDLEGRLFEMGLETVWFVKAMMEVLKVDGVDEVVFGTSDVELTSHTLSLARFWDSPVGVGNGTGAVAQRNG